MILGLALATSHLHAEITIDIVGDNNDKKPIVVSPFLNESASLPLTSIIRADLQRAGNFRTLPGEAPYPSDTTAIRYQDWQAKGTEAVVAGGMYPRANGLVEIRVRLFSIKENRELGGQSFTVRPAQFRRTGHQIADWIYEKLTGHMGVFNTRVAYVLKKGRRFELQVADTDGFNPQTVMRSPEPILSPQWSPDGSRLAYVSFAEMKKPVVFVHSLASGQRQRVAAFKGSNSAPAWFPDGRSLAVVLTKDGTSQIYRVFLDGSPVQRLTQSLSIDTEPSVSPDSRSILFVSDRGGSPQIYKLDLASGNVSRQTFEGSYNVSPHFSPDGKNFVFIRRDGSRFGVAVQDISSRQVQRISHGPADESPGFAPNGQIVLYAAREGRYDVLMAASINSQSKQRLHTFQGDLREPTWAPLARRPRP